MAKEPQPDGRAPRRAALRLLDEVIGKGRLLSDLAPLLDRLSPADRARASRLAVTALREIGRADALLAPALSRNPPLSVLNALRLGCVEIAQGAAPHGVVNDIVALVAAGRTTARFKGLVNAVLRRLAPEVPAIWPKLAVQRLPDWLRPRLVAAWGEAAVVAMEKIHADLPPVDLTAREDTSALADLLGGTLLPTGSIRLAAPGQISALPGYEAGEWWVQDAAAALPVRLLDPRPGERILDLCAAPGGKTMQLAAAGAIVTAVDKSTARAARLRANLERTGLAAKVLVADALDIRTGGWDAILLDAPCSATGTIRRHPDLPLAKEQHETAPLVALQSALIDHALSLLAPHGRLVFCTCSLLPEEGEDQTGAALARIPGLTVRPPAADAPWIDPRWLSPEGGLRIRPDHWADRGGIDGFYMVRLERPDTDRSTGLARAEPT